jgi:hypothetical protein
LTAAWTSSRHASSSSGWTSPLLSGGFKCNSMIHDSYCNTFKILCLLPQLRNVCIVVTYLL